MAADPLDGREVDSGLHQGGDRRVAHNMKRDLCLEAGGGDRLGKQAIHASAMPGAAVLVGRKIQPV
jgi:hypothetical protein